MVQAAPPIAIIDRGLIRFAEPFADVIPEKTELLANYPNRFNPETWIPYRLAEAADVAVTIYDSHGGVVRAIDLGRQTSGVYTDRSKAIRWDSRNDAGEQVGSGLYFYHLKAGDYSRTRRMLVVK